MGAFLWAAILPTFFIFNSLRCLIFSSLPTAGTVHQVSTCRKNCHEIGQLPWFDSVRRPCITNPKRALPDSLRPPKSVGELLLGASHLVKLGKRCYPR
jgi:hypothetical protein